MKNITLDAAIGFQDIFVHGDAMSPYELVDSWQDYHPLVIIGEVGTLINNRYKSARSPNDYSGDIENDCADIFISLLILGMEIEKKTEHRVFSGIRKAWSAPAKALKDEVDFLGEMESLIAKMFLLAKPGKEKYYAEEFFSKVFLSMKEISAYASGKDWQNIMDGFHNHTLDRITNFERYTPDLWYRGSCQVDFKKLLAWIGENEVALPKKRMLFLERMDTLRRAGA